MKPISVLLVDDHTLVRKGIRSLLDGFAGIEVAGEAGNGREALVLIGRHLPNVVLLDLAMEGLSGLGTIQRVVKLFPNVRVLILSMHNNEEYVRQALLDGASGYLLKDALPSELEVAVRAVASGKTYLSPAVSKYIVHGFMQHSGSHPGALQQLTPRQREILQLIAEGKTTKEIAQVLNVSVRTVETHRSQLMNRLDIHEVAGLVRYAVRVGLITLL